MLNFKKKKKNNTKSNFKSSLKPHLNVLVPDLKLHINTGQKDDNLKPREHLKTYHR